MMEDYVKEAQYYEKLNDGRVICYLCPHGCEISNGKIGKCRVRKNIEGKLITLNYGKVSAYHLDPIEKKPLYHFYPGKKVFSIGSFGCNLKCSFCQNYTIAHEVPQCLEASPADIVEIANRDPDNIGVAFTYNEPSIWYEYVLDTARLVKKTGKANIIVTNGYITKEPLSRLIPYIDAMNIDLKAISNKFYNDICKGKKNQVLETIITAAKHCHVEITTLLIEGLNTKEEEMIEICKWIESIDEDIPLHLTRYYPAYKMDLPPTSEETITKLYEVARRYLNYVYIGNIYGVNNNTYCPNCKALIVSRGFESKIQNLTNRKCNNCGKKIKIVL